jgi:hypothetical protein
MKNLTIEDIRNMSDEEVAALNKKLSRKIVINFIAVPIVIYAASYALNRYLESRNEGNQ